MRYDIPSLFHQFQLCGGEVLEMGGFYDDLLLLILAHTVLVHEYTSIVPLTSTVKKMPAANVGEAARLQDTITHRAATGGTNISKVFTASKYVECHQRLVTRTLDVGALDVKISTSSLA